jgi:UDP-glucuronate 4-epimerase
VNLTGTLRLLEACRAQPVGRFVLASSSSVYGCNAKIPFAEADMLEGAISPYATSKLAAEHLLHTYARVHGVPAVALRFFTVYGPHQRPDLAIAKFARALERDEMIDQYGDGSSARDYTYVSDIVAGLLAAAAYTATPYEVINLGGAETHTLADLIAQLARLMGREPRLRVLPMQAGDVPRTSADIAKARRLLGWSPQVTLADGLARYLAWRRLQPASER